MKTSTSLCLLLSVAAFATGCAKKETTAASSPAPAAAAPAASAPTTTTAAAPAAGVRTITVEANDAMKFSVTKIEAAPGEQLKIILKNAGSLPKEAMGHNLVVLKAGTDANAFCAAAVAAKATEYIPAAQADKVVAHTKLLGPKQSDEITFKVPSEPGDYPYVCSFPAHAMAGMKGVLVVK